MPALPTPVTGGCLCGQVRYSAQVYLQEGCICHCTICRKSSGQPAELTVFVKPGTLTYSSGQPSFFASSASGKRGFCATCGSRLVWQASDPAEDGLTNLCVGSLDHPEQARMACHIHAAMQLPWYDPCADLARFADADVAGMTAFLRP
jgi:hypothetical protein